jgi:hypothetical protein
MKTESAKERAGAVQRAHVLFGMMVSQGNIGQAEKTAAAFDKAAKSGDSLAIQTDDLIRAEPPLKSFIEKRRTEAWRDVFVCDKQMRQCVAGHMAPIAAVPVLHRRRHLQLRRCP